MQTHDFELNYYDSTRHYNPYSNADYIRRNFDLYTWIEYGNKEFFICWQNGQSYIGNNYNCPSCAIEISYDAGTADEIEKVMNYVNDYDDKFDRDEEVRHLIKSIDDNNLNTPTKLKEFYKLICLAHKEALEYEKSYFHNFEGDLFYDDYE